MVLDGFIISASLFFTFGHAIQVLDFEPLMQVLLECCYVFSSMNLHNFQFQALELATS